MTSLPRVRLTQKSTLTILLLALLVFAVHLFARTRINEAHAIAVQQCTTFAGFWGMPRSNASWHIAVRGNVGRGTYKLPNQLSRAMSGTISGNRFTGQWNDIGSIDTPRTGTFVATLSPAEHKIRVTFHSGAFQIDSAEWVCRPVGAPPTPTPGTRTPPTPTPTPWVAPTPPPEPTPTPRPTSVGSDHDTDNFETFDSLTPTEQRAVLVRRGPRLPVWYLADDLPMRVLVKSGWPIILEYGLTANDLAVMSIQIADRKPILVKLPPTPRDQISKYVPRLATDEIQVAKVRIKTADDGDEFRLYGFGMGDNATRALRQIAADILRFELAMNSPKPDFHSNIGLSSLLAPQMGSSVKLSVSLPASLKAKQKPEQEIAFSCTSNSDFSDGRWEWWRVKGLKWEKVWQKGSGAISRNQPRSQKWNGIITQFKEVSRGRHALNFIAWQKAGAEHEWVAARTDPALEVIE